MKKQTLLYTALLTLTLAACSGGNNVREKLGLQPTPPDEFSVVSRAPLSVPPDYTLRPPRPGESRPMELSVREQTRQTVFGRTSSGIENKSSPSDSFMDRLGAKEGNEVVRAELDAELRELDRAEQAPAERLLFWKEKEPRGKAIDPVEEQRRLEGQVEKRNEDVLAD